MATKYKVKVGDTLGGIAKQFGVQTSAITGYRSGNANTIFPDEELTINSPYPPLSEAGGGVIAPPALGTQTSTPPVLGQNPAPGAPVAPGATPTPPGVGVTPPVAEAAPPAPTPGAPVTPGGAPGAIPGAGTAPVAPVVPEEPPVRTFKTPSGVEVDETGGIVRDRPEAGLESILQELADVDPERADALMQALGYSSPSDAGLSRFGFNPQALERGFATNPSGTLSEMVQEVMRMTNLPDVRSNIENITKQIEELELARDAEIKAVNDNPFLSAGSQRQQIELIADKYEKRLGYRTDRLTLLQNAYSQARQEAQFAVSTAIGLYDKNRQFDQESLKMYFDRIEKAQAANKNLGFELSPGQVRYQLDPVTGEYKEVASLPMSGELGGLSKEQRTYLNQIQDNARQDPNVKEFPAVRASFETARSAALKRTGVGDVVLMRMIAKITDPTTGVREEEFQTFANAQSTLAAYGIKLTKQMWEGDRLTDNGRLQLYQQAKDIYLQRLSAYNESVGFFDKQASDAGLPSGIVMPIYTAPAKSGEEPARTPAPKGGVTSSKSGGWF